MKARKPKVFISHITEDADIAVPLASLLRESFLGFLDFFVSSDGASIRAGDKWSAVIETSLRESDLMLVVITPESLARKWIYFEAGGAYFLKKRVIPVCCKNVRVEDLGPPLNWLQAIHGWLPGESLKIPQEIARTFEASCPAIAGESLASICLGGAEAVQSAELQPPTRQAPAIPIFLLVDTSGSMLGAPIEVIRRGVDLLLDKLRSIEDATPMVSIISFGSGARTDLPLTAVSEINNVPELAAGGTTDLGAALHLLAQTIVNPALMPGRLFRPFIAVILDGYPTDDWRGGLEALLATKRGRAATRIGMAYGEADVDALREVSQSEVVRVEKPEDMLRVLEFFSWLSSSISLSAREGVVSVEIGEGSRWSPVEI